MTARHAATHGGHHFCFTHFLFIILAQAAETGAGGARTRRHASGDSDLQPGDVLLIKPKAQRDDVRASLVRATRDREPFAAPRVRRGGGFGDLGTRPTRAVDPYPAPTQQVG